ncbi:unnamed protein product [Paramecium sonneborni]|uniref:Transmembrane protein n=1 Tax=Paramecium sonneborni TaxID=65129 RepID=A0A8S1PTF8_9CILI|nr:unnamed protein product [Paramecium sonneborni]
MKQILLILIIQVLITSKRVGISELNQIQCIKSNCKSELQNCYKDESCFSVIQLCNKDFDNTQIAQNMNNCLHDETRSNFYIQCVANKCLKKLSVNFSSF